MTENVRIMLQIWHTQNIAQTHSFMSNLREQKKNIFFWHDWLRVETNAVTA